MKLYLSILIFALANTAASVGQSTLKFQSEDTLPDVMIAGEPAKIHTQGLFVTDKHFLVTGRLETKPKRALLLRFVRRPGADASNDVDKSSSDKSSNPETVKTSVNENRPIENQLVEWLDITPPLTAGESLDHPGGFDVDANGRLWIPLSTSHRRGPTIVRRFLVDPNKPLREVTSDFSFTVADHIGAICRGPSDQLCGANWDTQHVYLWNSAGKLQAKTDRNKLMPGNSSWQLAVQDWKLTDLAGGSILAGGLDKSPGRPSDAPAATIQVLRSTDWNMIQQFRLPDRAGVARPLTNEGLAWHKGEIYLLPEDLGRGAKVLRFRIVPQPKR